MKNRAPVMAVLCILLLSGCGGHSAAGHTAAGDHPAATSVALPEELGPEATSNSYNDADVMFLQMLIPYNGQGMDVAWLADSRGVNGEVKKLAASIVKSHTSEIATAAGWLKGWNKPMTAPPDEHDHHGGMPGMTAQELKLVKEAPDEGFQEKLLNTLIAHHDDAVQMARGALADGSNPEVMDLAKKVEALRSSQVKQMLKLLGQ
ncbi:Uncharacterized conserved protein, DUF305 family [Sinosporangium album]|uniref:Uncharacterized conserved protein, DUF305 family n=1 Tax=Sinosporangium album TaxID=504805 RepID=A0A1G8E4V5_9ACTN|nr:DUF305 domain-containing protein [Sinosporangium album]SDH64750.1 Uncharacterized conserved protein, DUF305 family [Sinosporangium album]